MVMIPAETILMAEMEARDRADAARRNVEQAVMNERARCAAIVQRAREGEIDGDLRSIIHRIQTGGPSDA